MVKSIVSLFVVLLMTMAVATAQELYKWVDDQGVTHYGDTLPDQHVEHESFKFAEYTQQANSSADYYSIQNQLQRLQDRRAAELERKQQLAEIKAAKNPPKPDTKVTLYEPERRYYSPAYYPYGFIKPYIKGVGHYHKADVKHHHSKHAHLPRKSIDRPKSGLVFNSSKKPTKAVLSASK